MFVFALLKPALIPNPHTRTTAMTDWYEPGGISISEVMAGSSQSTVSADLELERRDDSFLSDIDSTTELAHTEVHKVPTQGGKVAISDLFKRLKPTSVQREPKSIPPLSPAQTPSEPDEVLVIPSDDSVPQPKSGVTAKDLLTGFRKPQRKHTEPEQEPETVPISEIISSPPLQEAIIVEAEKTRPKTGITARDILVRRKRSPVPEEVVDLLTSEDEDLAIVSRKTNKRKNKRLKTENTDHKSLLITLYYKPQHQRIAELEKKIKSSSSRSVSAKDLLRSFGRKQEEKAIIDPEISNVDRDVFHTEGTRKLGNAGKSLLDVLSYKPTAVKNTVSKLKRLDPPKLTLEEFHVTYDHEPINYRHISLPHRQSKLLPNLDLSSFCNPSKIKEPTRSTYTYTTMNAEPLTLAKERIQTLGEDTRFDRFLDMMDSFTTDMWTTDFQPKSSDDLLLHPSVVRRLQTWLNNSYKILKKRTKRHDFKKGKKSAVSDLDDFIIDEDDETDDDEYTPLAILVGPSGIGKSSAVYTLVEENSGYVYEINASQARSRKDILANVKELSTTQLVHQNEDTASDNEFQKGVILFEDVDVLFESERSFWSVIENTLTISRRPIILTCQDLSVIPQNIIDCADKEGTLFYLEKQCTGELCDYLYLTGLAKGFDIDKEVLEHVVSENSRDLRKCLLATQMICEVERPPLDEITKVSLTRNEGKRVETIDDVADLERLSGYLEMYSLCDLLEQSTSSFIHHEPILNEAISAYSQLFEDDLRVSTLPFEFDMPSAIVVELPTFPTTEVTDDDMNEVRRNGKKYFSSKTNGFRLTRRGISSLGHFTSEVEGDYDNSVFEILPTSAFVTDISPALRELARYDQAVMELNKKLRTQRDDDDIVVVEKRRSSRKAKMDEDHLPLGARRKFSMLPSTLLYGDFIAWKYEK